MTASLADGGFIFEKLGANAEASARAWTPSALPTIVTLTTMSRSLTNEAFNVPAKQVDSLLESPSADYAMLRINAGAPPGASAILLPFDQLFEVRAASALRLWRRATGRPLGPDHSALSPERCKRLILALQALDGRLSGASHRQIANVFFQAGGVSDRDWITHDLRDRTGRLVRLGASLMNGGYRRLLLHPYRRLP